MHSNSNDVVTTGTGDFVCKDGRAYFFRNPGEKLQMRRQIRTVGQQAFTLVELLMVVAILMLFMALLLPALKTAREHGRRAKCLSNLHQISIAMVMYADQNNGKLPPYFYTAQKSVNGSGDPSYQILIKAPWTIWDVGMISNAKILLCPTDRNPTLINTTDPKGNPIVVPTSYGYNFEPFMQGTGILNVDFSQTVLIFDGKPDQISGDWSGNGSTTIASLGGSGSGGDGGVSLAGANGGGTGGGSSGGSSGGSGGVPTCPSCGSGGKQWICHIVQGNNNNKLYSTICTGDPSLSTHVFNHGDPCGTCDVLIFNDQLLDRRHFNRANIIFLDGHGEWLTALPSL